MGIEFYEYVEHQIRLGATEYQNLAAKTAVYPKPQTEAGFNYVLHGFQGEAGEVSNKYKKILRKEENYMDHREVLMDELGDALWYAALLARELGYTLEEVMRYNLNKLAQRASTGQLKDHK